MNVGEFLLKRADKQKLRLEVCLVKEGEKNSVNVIKHMYASFTCEQIAYSVTDGKRKDASLT